MHLFVDVLTQQYKQYADATKAAGAKAYMLNQFKFYGTTAPVRRKLDKEHLKQFPLSDLKEVEALVKALWNLPEREYQYLAIELFAYYKQLWKPSCINMIKYCITHKSWWDTVDAVASEWAGAFFKLHPKQKAVVTSAWNQGNNMWLQRTSIIFQKAYKKETDTHLLSSYILHCKGSKEFFIQKAIGWALREYSKVNPPWVKQFVLKNELPALSKREALKRITKNAETSE